MTFFNHHTIRSTVGHITREILTHGQILRANKYPRVAFLPSDIRAGSSLLRIFNIASALDKKSWGTLVVPKQLDLHQRRRVFKHFNPQLIVVQGARHILNRSQYFKGFRYILDLDDADFHDPDLGEHLEVLARESVGVIAGSRYIAKWASQFAPRVAIIWTGTPRSSTPHIPHINRAPIITWAQAAPTQYPAEMSFVSDVMNRLIAIRQQPLYFRLYGCKIRPSSEELAGLDRPEIKLEFLAPMEYNKFLESLREVAVGLSPIVAQSPFSRGKSFGKILGYLDAQVPVICSNEADHELFFQSDTGLVSNDPQVWAEELNKLLDNPEKRETQAKAAYINFANRLSIDAAADLTNDFLTALL